ncbi:hypothetical protein DCC85_04265 [Paenibacillus sp. CAA11]|uniref:DUF4097 family beta strand repeat-containing protein n=1 Tax=Paenibacillus sp. CAA11 TaxID=1532905 RepID=UPI000D38CC40|nr:DUF4097 family beta strand repeat-containing protein [Paenibacillus sp. CAA11]AWB43513.1 hypothetical protein DCC85_04265 [Paenibacillus sp. CAA11]
MKFLSNTWAGLLGIVILLAGVTGCDGGTAADLKSKTFENSQVKRIVITTEGQNIKLVPSSSGQIKVSYPTKKDLPAELKGDELSVHIKPSSGFIHLGTATLSLEVPAQGDQSLEVRTESGNITVDPKLQLPEVKLDTDSGNVDVQGYIGSVEATTNSGKIIKPSDLPLKAEGAANSEGRLTGVLGNQKERACRLLIHSSSGNISFK